MLSDIELARMAETTTERKAAQAAANRARIDDRDGATTGHPIRVLLVEVHYWKNGGKLDT